jgi:CoA:oxalate CoA-transferase
MKPLDGILVLDLSRVLSGPHCGRMLHDLGAEVIKVEPPEGDLTRFSWPRFNSVATYYAQQNVGKLDVSMDLKKPEAVDLLRRLAMKADVVLENFRPGVLERLGLGYDTLAPGNPRLVHCSISGYGQSGPWRDRRAYAAVVHAETGITHGQATSRGDRPTNDRYSHADVYTGMEACSAILAALFQRERTGRGQSIDVAMAQTMLYVNEHTHFDVLPPADPGEQIPSFEPGSYPVVFCANGDEVLIAGHPADKANFADWVEITGRTDLLEDARFASVKSRREHIHDLNAVIAEWAKGIASAVDLERAVDAQAFAVGQIRTTADLAASDWAADRGALVPISDRGDGTIPVPQAPWIFSDAQVGITPDDLPAYRGEHNREVLQRHLGVDDAEFDRLEASGVLSSRIPRKA